MFAPQVFLSSFAAEKLWMRGRLRCGCSSQMSQGTFLEVSVAGMSWWCVCSPTRPSTPRWWARNPAYTLALRKLSWTSPTRADTRQVQVDLCMQYVLYHNHITEYFAEKEDKWTQEKKTLSKLTGQIDFKHIFIFLIEKLIMFNLCLVFRMLSFQTLMNASSWMSSVEVRCTLYAGLSLFSTPVVSCYSINGTLHVLYVGQQLFTLDGDTVHIWSASAWRKHELWQTWHHFCVAVTWHLCYVELFVSTVMN